MFPSALPPLFCVVGPTASGKSALAIKLAKALNAEVISVDASQVYEGLDVGTGKVRYEELEGVPHHLLDVAPPDGRFDVSRFVELAERSIKALRARGKRAVLCGGTGLYFKGLLYGLCEAPPVSDEVRAQLARRIEAGEVELMHQELSEVDPALAAKLQPRDKQRVERALGVYLTTGTPLSTLQAAHGFEEQRAPVMMVGIDHERAALNERIELRVRQMWAGGFLEEVATLKARGYGEALQSMGAIGYRLAMSVLEGELTQDEAITKMIYATRQYARRQRRYFDRQLPTEWWSPHALEAKGDELLASARAFFERHEAAPTAHAFPQAHAVTSERAFFERHEADPTAHAFPQAHAVTSERAPFEVRLWGDKSVGHRAFMFSALMGSPSAPAQSALHNIGQGADLASTRAVLKALGVTIEPLNSSESGSEPGSESGSAERSSWRVIGRGLEGLSAPQAPLDCGNSGTTIRLLSGLLSGLPKRVTLDGDASLRRRPMGRLARALAPLGRHLELGPQGGAPVSVGGELSEGAQEVAEVEVNTQLASAQVKSAALLAALSSRASRVKVTERALSRDHTERMMSALGWSLEREVNNPLSVALSPQRSSTAEGFELSVPGDPSSAAFWVAVSALSPQNAPPILLRGCLNNPTRTGFFRVARRMGVELELRPCALRLGEPIADVCVWGAPQGLRGVTLSEQEALDCLDELPLVALLGALAQGQTVVRGAQELRVKESDRIEAMSALLNALGARVQSTPDGWEIEGVSAFRGGRVESAHDHRVALCGRIASLATQRAQGAQGAQGVEVEGYESAGVSYPEFEALFQAYLDRLASLS